jgi:hypothetical protein
VTSYAGLDVSQQETQVCVVDERGAVLWTENPRIRGESGDTIRGENPGTPENPRRIRGHHT